VSDETAEHEGERVGGFISGFLSGIFKGPQGMLIVALLAGGGAHFVPQLFASQQQDTYWSEAEIKQIVKEAAQEGGKETSAKIDRLAVGFRALVDSQPEKTRLKVFEELARYDSRRPITTGQ
jgi:hypothetical protein